VLIDEATIAKLTPAQRGLQIGLQLHWRADPKTWRAAVDAIACPETRQVADDYLRGIVVRMRAAKAAQEGTIARHEPSRAPAPSRADRMGLSKLPPGRR
jgi:hypothetical protein